MANKVHVKNGDQVMVISGNSKGTIGKVVGVSPKEGKVIVEGANIVKKHVKARRPQDQSGIIDAPASARNPFVPLTKLTATRRPASAANAALSSNAEV